MASPKGGFDDISRRDGERLTTPAANQPSDGEKENRSVAKLRTISVFKLQPHEVQPPERHSEENVADLLVSILELGLQNPPHAWRKPDGSYVILFGHRRVRAWQLGALEGRLPEKIRVFVRSDLTEGEDLKLMAAEYCHWKEFSTLHIARLVGEASRHLSIGQDGEISTRDLAAVLPWKKTSVGHYRAIYRMLEDPRLAPTVHRVDSPSKSLLNAIAQQAEFSTRREALEAYADRGAAAAREVLAAAANASDEDAPLETVTRETCGDGYDVTVRLRPNMTAAQVEEAEKALHQALDDLATMPKRAEEAVGTG